MVVPINSTPTSSYYNWFNRTTQHHQEETSTDIDYSLIRAVKFYTKKVKSAPFAFCGVSTV